MNQEIGANRAFPPGIRRVAVTGGTGFIGSHVVEALLARGVEVSCLVLPGEPHGWLEGLPVSFFVGDLVDASGLAAFLEGTDAVIHLAGLTRAPTEDRFNLVNAHGSSMLGAVARSLSPAPRHIVAMSSLAAMGPCTGDEACIDEDDQPKPLTPYGRSKVLMEKCMPIAASPIPCTFFRGPPVYGPRDRDVFQLFDLVSRGLRPSLGPKRIMSVLYVKNLVHALLLALLEPKAFGEAFNVADPEPLDWEDFGKMIETRLGRRALRLAVPEFALSAAAAIAEAGRPFRKSPPLITKEKLLEMRQTRWVASIEKARDLLGYVPLYSTGEAVGETAAWYKTSGWLR